MLKSCQGFPVAWALGMRGSFTGASFCLGRLLGEERGKRESSGFSVPDAPLTLGMPSPWEALQWLPTHEEWELGQGGEVCSEDLGHGLLCGHQHRIRDKLGS